MKQIFVELVNQITNISTITVAIVFAFKILSATSGIVIVDENITSCAEIKQNQGE